MKLSSRQILLFTASCAVTSAIWIGLNPRSDSQVIVAALPESSLKETVWNAGQLQTAVRAVTTAATDQARLEACGELQRIPAENFPAALDHMDLGDGHGLPLAVKVLLIRWASDDGEAAMNWAWKRFRRDGRWETAFRQIGPAWAARRPSGLAKWAIAAAAKTPPAAHSVSVEEATLSEVPIAESPLITNVTRWLVTEDPHLAYQVLLARGGMSSEDAKLPMALHSVANVRDALSAFDNLDKMDAEVIRGSDYAARCLISRWQELDPEDFSRSPHTRFASPNTAVKIHDAAGKLASLPPSERAAHATRIVADGNSGSWMFTAVVESWARVDSNAVGEWLESLPSADKPIQIPARSVLAGDHLDEILRWSRQFSPEERVACFVKSHDAWVKAHPGERPDMTNWSPHQRMAWKSLETLQVRD